MPRKGARVNKAVIERSDGRFRISGELTFATVTPLLAESRGLFAGAGHSIEVDLSRVERADSAGLALLIEWMRQARNQEQSIRFFNLPEQLMAIASASDLDGILPLARGHGESS